MADGDKLKISALPAALTLDNTDVLPGVQGQAGSATTKKISVATLGGHIVEDMEFSSQLQTSSKKIIGAINELAQGGGGGGSSTLSGLTDVNLASPSNGQVLKYNGTNQKWENANESGGASWTDVTGTLTAGSTSVTLSNASIASNSTIQVFTPDGTEWNSITVDGSLHTVTVTFDAQQSDMAVKVRIS